MDIELGAQEQDKFNCCRDSYISDNFLSKTDFDKFCVWYIAERQLKKN